MSLCFVHAGEPELRPLLERITVAHGRAASRQAVEILRWGTIAPDGAGARTLNPLASVLRVSHPRGVRELLAIHGIKTADNTARWTEEYRIPVFALEPLAVFAKRPRQPLLPGNRIVRNVRFEEIVTDMPSYHHARAKRQAVRAVYALGLDFALVSVGITPEGGTAVCGVDPSPVLDERLAQLLADAFARYEASLRRELGRVGSPMLGADPEFVLRRPGGKVVSAARYFDRDGRVGSDAVVLRGQRVISPLVELRPDPTPDPRLLTRRIAAAMSEAAAAIRDPELEWLAGGMPVGGLPLGGHIHFSGVRLNSFLLRALDNYAALPLLQLEAAGSFRRRPRYGRLGDFRRQPHGGFEYRTLPSWLAAPELAAGVLALARVVAEHYRELRRRPLDSRDLLRAFYAGDLAKAAAPVDSLWRELEATSGYAAFRPELDALRDRIATRRGWDEQADIRPAWGIRTDEEPPARTAAPRDNVRPGLFRV